MALYPLPRKLRAVFFCNIVSATLWFCCLGRFMILLPLVGRRFLPVAIADFFHVVSVIPLCTFFAVNLLGRREFQITDLWGLFNGLRMVWICYGVIYPHPKIAKHTSYSFLILSWCIQNLIDSTYYAFKIKTKASPMWLFKLHHLHFYITFPVALVSEMILLFLSCLYEKHRFYDLFLDGCLLMYIPVAFFAFRHLLARKAEKYDTVLEKRRLGRTQNIPLQPLQMPAASAEASETEQL